MAKSKTAKGTAGESTPKQIGVINKFCLDLANLASDDRYYLNGIHFTSDFTEVTNGHYLVRITNPKIDPGDLPNGPNGSKVYTEQIETIIPAETAKQIQKNIPKSKKYDTYAIEEIQKKNKKNKRSEYLFSFFKHA